MDKWLRNNTVAKIVAFALALMLWAVLNIENDSPQAVESIPVKTLVDVPVEVRYDASSYKLVKEPAAVTVVVQGEQSLLNQVQLLRENYTLYVNVSHLSSGTHTVPVQHSDFPSGVSIRVEPEKVEVGLEKLVTVTEKVAINVTGEPQPGYEMSSPVVSPSEIQLTLPESEAERVARVEANVNVQGVQQNVEKTSRVQVLDQDGEIMDVEPEPRNVDVTVSVDRISKTVPLRIPGSGFPPEGYAVERIQVQPETVRLFGPISVLEEIDELQTAEVDVSSYQENQTLTVELPQPPEVQDVEPREATVTVEIVASEQKTFEDVPISVQGLDENETASILEPESGGVDIVVEGSPKRLQSLNQEDVSVFVDGSGLGEGEYDRSLQTNLPSFIRRVEENSSVSFRIESVTNEENPS